MKNTYYFLLVFALFFHSCISFKSTLALKAEREQKMFLDSTGIISTHPSRPFKYGYAIKEEELYQYKEEIKRLDIKNGETIASVGAASGWLEGILSLMTDSITYYIQDIDTSFLNNEQFQKVVNYYTALREKPQTNTFYYILGNKRYSNLPDETFDKILITNAFHEIDWYGNANYILRDLKSKLDVDGKIIISDETSSVYKKIRHKGCNIKAFMCSDVISKLNYFGYYLTNMTEPENSFYNNLTFEHDPTKGLEFSERRKKVEKYIVEMDKFNTKEIYSDSVKAFQLALSLKPHIAQLTEVYPFLSDYLIRIANEFSAKKKNIGSVINLFKANLLLFPDYANTYENLGDVYYYALENSSLAKEFYSKVLQLEPENLDVKKAILEIEEKISKREN